MAGRPFRTWSDDLGARGTEGSTQSSIDRRQILPAWTRQEFSVRRGHEEIGRNVLTCTMEIRFSTLTMVGRSMRTNTCGGHPSGDFRIVYVTEGSKSNITAFTARGEESARRRNKVPIGHAEKKKNEKKPSLESGATTRDVGPTGRKSTFPFKGLKLGERGQGVGKRSCGPKNLNLDSEWVGKEALVQTETSVAGGAWGEL